MFFKHIEKEKLFKFLMSSIIKNFNSCFIMNIFGIYGYKEILKREFLGKPKKYIFENSYIYGPENYDEYLKTVYGNYMELPPLDKQTGHKPIVINLTKPFSEW